MLFILLLTAGCAGCRDDGGSGSLEKEADQLLKTSIRFQCLMEEKNRQARILWDSVTQNLARNLPEGMPVDERRNMIAVRNASLIRMFKVYPELDSNIRRLVDEADLKDAELAGSMRNIKDSLDANETAIRRMLARIEAEKASLLEEWKKKFDTARCNND